MHDDPDKIAREIASINAWSRVADLRSESEELARLVRGCLPGNDALDCLSDDQRESRLQLIIMHMVRQGNTRRLVELLIGEPLLVGSTNK